MIRMHIVIRMGYWAVKLLHDTDSCSAVNSSLDLSPYPQPVTAAGTATPMMGVVFPTLITPFADFDPRANVIFGR